MQQYEEAHPGLAARVSVFSSGPELLNQAEEENGFDLYILDVIMPKMNGIELGLKLRSINSDGVIIYLTTSRDYAVESYLVQAFYYLLKPVDKTAFYTVLDKAVSMLEKQSMASIEVRTANGIRRLSFDEIMYVELAKRFAKYHLTDEKVINSITLRNSFHTEVAPLLKDERQGLLQKRKFHDKGINKCSLNTLPLQKMNFQVKILYSWPEKSATGFLLVAGRPKG